MLDANAPNASPLDTGMPYIKMYFLFKMSLQNDKQQHTLMYELTTANSDKHNITKHCDKLVTIDKQDSLCHNNKVLCFL